MTTMADIESAIAERHLLTHPFYRAWSMGTLPTEALVDYARQYYAFETALPRFLTALHSRSDDKTTRAALLDNAWDEEHGEANHAELWLRFAESLGVSRGDVLEAEPNAATRTLVDTYRDLSQHAPVEAGVAALYAYESQLPAVSDAKIAGLTEHYGFESASHKRGLAFFETHRTLDVTHAAAERAVVEKAVTPAALDGAKRALDAWWVFLDAFVPAKQACA